MRTMNKVLLIGHLGSPPQLKHSSQDRPYTHLNLATKRRWKDSQEKWQEKTDWHSVTVWGRQAEVCVEQLIVGSLLMVDGYLSTMERPSGGESSQFSEKRVFITSRRVTFLTRPQAQYEAEEELETESLAILPSDLEKPSPSVPP